MAERFLILWASSFYGSNFARLVEERGDEFIGMSRQQFDLGKGDINPVVDKVILEKPDYVVNFISRSSVVESWESPSEWMNVNAKATSSLIYCMNRYGARKFIHVSTPEVYGSTPEWVKEDHPFNPTTPYAVSRAAGDMMLKAFHKAYGFPMVITRTANIYGPGQQSYRLIPKALEAKRTGEPLLLHGGGQSVRSFIHIKDACEATYLIAKQGFIGETYHISTNHAYSIEDVVSMIECPFEWAP